MMDAPELAQQAIGMEWSAYWKRVGMLGFAFFFIKGMLWLVAPILLYFLA